MDCPAELAATPAKTPYRSPGPGIGAFSVQEFEAVTSGDGAPSDGSAEASGWVGGSSPQPRTAAVRTGTSADVSRRRLRDCMGITLASAGAITSYLSSAA